MSRKRLGSAYWAVPVRLRLRHGIDVVFIQKLLGHNDLKTTLRYLHVTNKDTLNIVSPLEILRIFYRKLE